MFIVGHFNDRHNNERVHTVYIWVPLESGRELVRSSMAAKGIPTPGFRVRSSAAHDGFVGRPGRLGGTIERSHG